MFRNLYFLDLDFRDFNFNDFLNRFEEVPEEYIEARICGEHQGEPIEPYFEPIIPLTLSPEACASYLRSYPRFPVSQRDYYLSKLFQFLFLPIKVKIRPEFDEELQLRWRLEAWLDSIDNERLEQLHGFDWWGFYEETFELDLDEIFARLPFHLPGAEGSAETPTTARQPVRKRGPKADIENHLKVLAIVQNYEPDWRQEDQLDRIARELDKQKIPAPRAWQKRKPVARSWRRAVDEYPELVIKSIEYRLKQAREHRKQN